MLSAGQRGASVSVATLSHRWIVGGSLQSMGPFYLLYDCSVSKPLDSHHPLPCGRGNQTWETQPTHWELAVHAEGWITGGPRVTLPVSPGSGRLQDRLAVMSGLAIGSSPGRGLGRSVAGGNAEWTDRALWPLRCGSPSQAFLFSAVFGVLAPLFPPRPPFSFPLCSHLPSFLKVQPTP